MKISIFTPHSAGGIPYIRETWESLQAQTRDDWEWIVVENHGGKLPKDIKADPRVVVVKSQLEGVGALKGLACSLAKGDVLLELDHDDVLRSDTLGQLELAFTEGADFVYSDFAEFRDGTWAPNPYSSSYGWESYAVDGPKGHPLVAMKAPEDPVAWRRIEWAPNHLRAWRTETYRKLGGHDANLHFADDHDLVLRTYLSGANCVRIPKCLYFYRVHGQQNVQTQNAKIQEIEAQVYDRYIYRLAESQVVGVPDPRRRYRSLKLIDLCGAHSAPEHYTPMDQYPCKERPDLIVADLEESWPLEDSSVGVLRAFDAIEHLRDPVHTMNEAHRVLSPGGFMLIMVPSTDAIVEELGPGRSRLINGSGAYCDPTHVSFWNALSFRYYCDDSFRKYVPTITARFQASRVRTINAGGIPYVQAELIAVKDGYHPMGSLSGI